MIKFNYGVELGAYLAYLGHYNRTGNIDVLFIAWDEHEHRKKLGEILDSLEERPSKLIDFGFPTGVSGNGVVRQI